MVVWGCVGRPGGDLLSRALRRSTMGAGGFHVRVRDGIGCRLPAKATRSSNTAPRDPLLRIERAGSGVGMRWNAACCSICSTVMWMIAVHGLTPGLVGMGIIGNFEPIGRLGPVS
jgi:hypothetical protein